VLRRFLVMFYNELRAAVREWTGDAEYERYVRHCAERGQAPLERGRFFAERLEERHGTRARCC
jgi:uncharacterized short protein YbdD (DUF466 family)